MIIGDGLIANSFSNYKDIKEICIFASGVSNSKETSKINFLREESLLLKSILESNAKVFVYFGTCSVYDKMSVDSKYVKHKLRMEKLVEDNCINYYIFRLSQVVGISKNSTLVNYLYDSIINDKHMYINKYSTRNLIYIGDVLNIVSYIIKNKIYLNEVINIASVHNILVSDVIKCIEKILQKKAKYSTLEIGSSLEIDIAKIVNIEASKNILKKNYVMSILNKYHLARK